jgi:ABC-type sugar transport system ATPase subunit
VLSESDAEAFLERLRDFRREGKAIVYVSHRLSEILSIADRLTVLRDGRNVGTFNRNEVNRGQVISLMAKADVGVHTLLSEGPRTPESHLPSMQIRGLGHHELLRDIDLSIRPGQIVGIAGVQGSGLGHLLGAIAGRRPYDRGTILIDGKAAPPQSVRWAYSAGIVLVPADRRSAAIVPSLSVVDNVVLPPQKDYQRLGVRLKNAEQAIARRLVEVFSIRAKGIHVLAGQLSGGNQQKLALARAMQSRPRLLLLEEPTQGIDISGKQEIRALILELAKQGVAIIVATSDFEELIDLADVVHVMCLGRLVAELSQSEASYERILHYALP